MTRGLADLGVTENGDWTVKLHGAATPQGAPAVMTVCFVPNKDPPHVPWKFQIEIKAGPSKRHRFLIGLTAGEILKFLDEVPDRMTLLGHDSDTSHCCSFQSFILPGASRRYPFAVRLCRLDRRAWPVGYYAARADRCLLLSEFWAPLDVYRVFRDYIIGSIPSDARPEHEPFAIRADGKGGFEGV